MRTTLTALVHTTLVTFATLVAACGETTPPTTPATPHGPAAGPEPKTFAVPVHGLRGETGRG